MYVAFRYCLFVKETGGGGMMSVRHLGLYIVCLSVCLLTVPAGQVWAQGSSEDTTVAGAAVVGRSRPEYDPVGARIGSFFLYPFATTGLFYDDNVLSVDVGEQGDTVSNSTAGLLIQSDWNRHLYQIELGVSNFTYFDLTEENHTDFYVNTKGRLDVTRDFNIGTASSAARLSEERGASDSPTAAAEPTEYTKLESSVSFNKQFNRVSVQVGGAIQDLDYDDVNAIGGGVIDQDIRDGQIYTAIFRSAYEFSPGYRAFGLVEGNWRDFGALTAATNRDSEGIEARAGLEFEITRLMAGEVSIGYLRQDYDSTAFQSTDGLAAKASLLWNPTMLMSVTFSGERRVSETTFSGASGHLDTLASIRVDYELLRNLILSPSVGYVEEDYQGVARTDETVTAGVALEYLINRRFSAKAYYVFTSKDSSISTFNYDKNKVGGSVKVQF